MFCNAPVRVKEPKHAAVLLHFATTYASKQPVELQVRAPDGVPETPEQLHHMENLHQARYSAPHFRAIHFLHVRFRKSCAQKSFSHAT